MSENLKKTIPHRDFKRAEAGRPDWDATPFKLTKTVDPDWKFGAGASHLAASSIRSHVAIDPFAQGRTASLNRKLLISAITPRPIALVSTISRDGKFANLAPFSYFNLVQHDPPMFVVGFACAIAEANDTLRNLLDTKECVINVISDEFIEAAHSTSLNVPSNISEWNVSGLTPVHDCESVKPARVKEAVLSIEAKLDAVREFDSRENKGRKSGTMVVLEGTRIWARKDAIDEDRSFIDPAVLRPIGRLGGIMYGRINEAFELAHPILDNYFSGNDS